MVYIITRENNKYNKYMKWHLLGRNEIGGGFSSWYKTRKEAEYYKNKYEEKKCKN